MGDVTVIPGPERSRDLMQAPEPGIGPRRLCP